MRRAFLGSLGMNLVPLPTSYGMSCSSGVSILQPFCLRMRVCPHRLICRRRTYARQVVDAGRAQTSRLQEPRTSRPLDATRATGWFGVHEGSFLSHPLRVSLSRTGTPGHLLYTPHRCMM
ncbi:hypothetical protein HDV57DRAFT_245365 [Trichoderma longibrachiatum]